jgi:hypothetical protein
MTEITHDGDVRKWSGGGFSALQACLSHKRGLVHESTQFAKRSCRVIEVINNYSIVALTAEHHDLWNTQLSREDASTTSKILSRALWVRRSPYRFTFNSSRTRMATNAASYNPSKKLSNCHCHSHKLTIAQTSW